MQKVKDNHVHIINKLLVPFEIAYSHKEINIAGLTYFLEILKRHDLARSTIEELLTLISSKSINLDLLINLYISEIIPVVKKTFNILKKNGVVEFNLLMIDYGNNYFEGQEFYDLVLRSLYIAIEQKSKLSKIKVNKYQGLHLDRSEDIILSEMIYSKKQNFKGFKLYPAMYQPYNMKKLNLIFDFCSKNKMNIITHCNTGGIGEFKQNNNPKNFIPFLLDFPNVNICFAHGGNSSIAYIDAIKRMNLEFETIYTDTAFNERAYFYPDEYFYNLGSGGVKVLFGSDLPLSSIYYSYMDFLDLFKNNLKGENQDNIFYKNFDEFMEC